MKKDSILVPRMTLSFSPKVRDSKSRIAFLLFNIDKEGVIIKKLKKKTI